MFDRSSARRGVALAALLLAAVLVAATAPAGISAGSTRSGAPPSLRQLAKRIVDVGVPGAVVLVHDERGLRAGVAGYGNLRTKQRFGPDHRFRIGSLTKTFVATVVVQLAAEGTLTLNDPVERWLPGLVPNGGAITLRQLLTHTSGIYNYTDDPYFLRQSLRAPLAAWKPEELVRIATEHSPMFAPGTSWSYSNTGYILLGLVVERATASSLGEQLQRQIFGSLGLTRTSLPTTPTLEAPFARGYLLPGNGEIPTPGGRPVDVTVWSPAWAWAAGGIVSSARDIDRFYAALLGGRLVAPAQLAEMQRVVAIPRTADGYGLGLQRISLSCGFAWGHGGSVPGYLTLALGSANAAHLAVVLVNATPVTSRQGARVEEALRSSFCR